ncbi:MAG: FtsX-like permease family protein [Ferruginibacter sp.]
MYFNFAWRYFRAKKSANAINIIAWVTTGVIAFATCCQVLVLSVFNGFEDLVKSLYSSFYADIKIIPAIGKTFFLTPAQLTLINKQSFIKKCSLVVEERALLQNGDYQSVVVLKGVDKNFKEVTGIAEKITRGEFYTGTAEEPQIIIGSGIQNATGITVNESFAPEIISVILPKKTTSADPLESISQGNVTASGIFAIQQDFDNLYALTNIDFVKQQMAYLPGEYTGVEIRLTNKADIETSKEVLTGILGDQYVVQTKYEQNTNLYNTMKTEKWAIYAVLTLILIIAAFNMISALTMLVLEKKQDIAILQSMGSTRASIQKIFLSEGVLLGVIGAASGIALAIIICVLQINFKLIRLQGGSFLIDYFPVKLIPADFILVSTTAIIIAFIASWFPAHKAAGQPLDLR